MTEVDYTRKWWVMAAVAMGVFLATIDGSIVNIALPNLVADLHESLAVVEWVVLAYLLTITTLMLSIGRLADMIGKKKLYIAGMIIFTIGSALCGLSTTVYMLIGFRVLQAIGAAMTQALGTAIVTEAFPDSERGKAMGVIGVLVSIGIVAGPTLGGLILASLTWHWLFFVNLPVGIIGVFMVLKFVPSDQKGIKQRFDFLGAGTLFISLVALLLALSIGQNSTFGSIQVIVLFIVFLVMLGLFLAIERRVSEPMIDLGMFANRLFSINLITGSLTFIASAGSVLLMPFYLQNMRGYSPEQAGLMLAVVPVITGIIAPISGSISDRSGSWYVTVIGLAIQVAGYSLLTQLTASTTVLGFILLNIPLGIGFGLFQSPNNSAVMGSAPKNRLGVASGLLSLTRTLGQTTGIAILSAIWSGRVLANLPNIPAGGATAAPISAQVAGLHDSYLIVVGIIVLALGFSISALVQILRSRQKPRFPARA